MAALPTLLATSGWRLAAASLPFWRRSWATEARAVWVENRAQVVEVWPTQVVASGSAGPMEARRLDWICVLQSSVAPA